MGDPEGNPEGDPKGDLNDSVFLDLKDLHFFDFDLSDLFGLIGLRSRLLFLAFIMPRFDAGFRRSYWSDGSTRAMIQRSHMREIIMKELFRISYLVALALQM